MTLENKPFLPYALPEIGNEEIAEVVDTLKSGWVTTGPKTRQFEAEFAAYLGGEVEALAVNSATSGLHLALEALGIGPGDEVITTTYTFTATAEVIRYLGADPIFVDIDPITLNIDPQKIATAITCRTKAIIPVHFGGLPCDMDAILALAHQHGLAVVEDAAHALPSRYQGKLIGTLGSDITVFSFYANKTMTTGEGGMVVTCNAELAKRVKVMRLHGINRDAFDRFTSKTPAWYYEVVAPGFKYNLTDIAAAIGIHQLHKLDRFLVRREALAKRYQAELADLPLILPANAPCGNTHSWHLYALRLKDDAPANRDQVIQHLATRGIGTSVHYVPLHRHPYWRDTYQLTPAQFPQADHAYQRTFSIPLYTSMSDDDQARVIHALRDTEPMLKRLFDLGIAVPAFMALMPLFLIIGLWIKLDSPGPVFYRQQRVGRLGKPFFIYKFRTMNANGGGLQITVGADPRITRSGTYLRHYKLDELPQIINILLGDMSLVGPRPEVPKYVSFYSEEDRALILSVRPGITDRASIHFRDENSVLASVDDPEKFYRDKILPIKIDYYRKYVLNRTFFGDIRIIIETFKAVFL